MSRLRGNHVCYIPLIHVSPILSPFDLYAHCKRINEFSGSFIFHPEAHYTGFLLHQYTII